MEEYNNSVWKYIVRPSDVVQYLEVPKGIELLSAYAQHNIITIAGKVDTKPTVSIFVKILVLGTGHKTDKFEIEKFLGTVLLNDDNNVYHVFQIK